MRLSIKHSAAGILAIGLAAVVLAACGGGGNGDDSSGSAATMGTKAGVVSVSNVDNTKVLTDSQGKTLYSADVEKGGQIMCTSGCTSFWTPVDASQAQAKTAAGDLNLDLGVVKRPDGARQLTFDGKPLYSFNEEGSGKLTGNGFVDDFHGTQFTWTAAATGGGQASSAPSNSPY
jgi:predicted lipoprotein with Yx(FWY)xxD motif